MLKKLFFLFLFFIITASVLAGELSKGVTPEQGKAWTLSPVYEAFDGSYAGDSYMELSFWNVGQLSGDPAHSKVVLSNDCSKSTTTGCGEGIPKEGSFTGGPDGIITIGGNEYKLKEGKYFEVVSGGKTTKYTVENPKIFSKYKWDGSTDQESSKLSEDKLNWAITSGAKEQERNNKVYTGKINAELGESAGFSDMFGQVEVNIPNEDGTYDEEAWSFAKLDGKSLPVGTHVKTSGKSGVLINFGQHQIHLGADSELVIAPHPDQPGPVGLLYGNLKANIKKIIKEGSIEIEMNQAVAGIKGTTFVLEETGNTSTLKVIEGSVSFTSKTSGKTESVNAGERLLADKNGLGQKTTFDTGAEEKQWAELAGNFKKTGLNKNIPYILGGLFVALVIAGLFLKSRSGKSKS